MSVTIPPRLRIALVLPGAAALAAGVLSGLGRLGLQVPEIFLQLSQVHGALMIGGFFGTLIGLERAVALGAVWPYLAPLSSAFAALSLIASPDAPWAPWLMLAASVVMTSACANVWKRQPEAHHATLAAGASAWMLGNVVWTLGGSPSLAVPFWALFLILTIAGERLELSRFVPTPPHARRQFAGIVVLLLFSAVAALLFDQAMRLYGLLLLTLAAWLLRFDIARRTIGTTGLTRYMATCLLSGYFWLGIAGLFGIAGGFLAGSPLRDAALHSLTLGFVFAMVFGHAPVILPSITRKKMRWHPGFYLPLVMLHVTLLFRIATTWTGDATARGLAGQANALVLLLFVLLVLESVVAGLRQTGQGGGMRT